jgi:hypothetical protein
VRDPGEEPRRRGLILAGVALAVWWPWPGRPLAAAVESPIRFVHKEGVFVLENAETLRRHAPETMAGGLAVFDYDRDGDVDLFFANGAEMPSLRKTGARYWNRLYANDGRARFSDVTERAGLAGSGYDTGVAAGDYDNDGDPDLFLAGVHRNTLYRNEGDGTFTDVTAAAGLVGHDAEHGRLWAVAGAFLDFDNDGWLDLLIVNYLSWDPADEPVCNESGQPDYCHPTYYRGLPNRLLRNRGNGTFEDVSASSGIRAHVGKGMGACAADFDQDGLADLFLTNDKLPNFLFRNLGGGRFRETAFEATVALPEHGKDVSGMGLDCRDVDDDGRPDVTFAALPKETFPLFRNVGGGAFEEITYRSGLSRLTRDMAGYGIGIQDFDNDGSKDIFVACGHVQSEAMKHRLPIDQHNAVFRNLGSARMVDLSEAAGLASAPARRHRGLGFGDLNGDGRVDVVVSALGAPAEIWLNESTPSHHWLSLRLVGTKSNRDAVGARIRVVTKGRAQHDHVSPSVGYASTSLTPLHFGLGTATAAELVEIHWPSGLRQQLKQVAGDRVVGVTEATAADGGTSR